MSCSSCNSSPCSCELNIPLGPRGFPGAPGPAPTLTFEVTPLAPGSVPTVNQTGGSGVYTIDLGIPTGATGAAGAAGADGGNAYTITTADFTQPALSFIVTLSVEDNSWAEVGQWVYVPGGGYYIVVTTPGETTIQLRNPGPAQGFPTGVAGNAVAGTTIATGTGVTPGGIPGEAGADGAPGDTGGEGPPGTDAELLVINTVPVAAPAPGRQTVIVTDDPVTPTFTRIYQWNTGTLTWSAVANIQGAAGTQWVSTAGDPNVTLPVAAIGSYALRTDVLSIYVKTGVSTWTLQGSLTPTFAQVATTSAGNFGTVPVSTQSVMGFVAFTDTHTSPGTYTFDLQYQGSEISADKDIELDWTDATYTENGQWIWSIENVDGSSINVTYAAGQFQKKTGLSLPATLAAGATQTYVLTKAGTDMLIIDTFVNVAV